MMNATADAMLRAALFVFGAIMALDLALIILQSRADLALFLICMGLAATAHAFTVAVLWRWRR